MLLPVSVFIHLLYIETENISIGFARSEIYVVAAISSIFHSYTQTVPTNYVF